MCSFHTIVPQNGFIHRSYTSAFCTAVIQIRSIDWGLHRGIMGSQLFIMEPLSILENTFIEIVIEQLDDMVDTSIMWVHLGRRSIQDGDSLA